MTNAELHALAEHYIRSEARHDGLFLDVDAARKLAAWALWLEAERDNLRADAAWALRLEQELDAAEHLSKELSHDSERWRAHYDAAQANWSLCLQRAEKAEATLAAIRKLCTDAGMTEDSLPEHYLVGVFYLLKRTLTELRRYKT